jgi:hypothetical protein
MLAFLAYLYINHVQQYRMYLILYLHTGIYQREHLRSNFEPYIYKPTQSLSSSLFCRCRSPFFIFLSMFFLNFNIYLLLIYVSYTWCDLSVMVQDVRRQLTLLNTFNTYHRHHFAFISISVSFVSIILISSTPPCILLFAGLICR